MEITELIRYYKQELTPGGYKDGIIDGLEHIFNESKEEPSKKTDVLINIKYELDRAAYKQFIADMKLIEAEFKSKFKDDNKRISYKDFVAEKHRKDEQEETVSMSYTGSMDNLIRTLGYTIHATDDGKSLRFERIDHVDSETTEQIPATLKGVCEWWIKTYSTKTDRKFYDTPARITMVRKHMKEILKDVNKHE